MSDQAYFKHHVFFCLNERNDGRACCASHDAKSAQEHAKQRLKKLDMNGQGKIRINKAGCLDRCDQGPVLVIYPEGTWYTYVDKEDIDEIVDSHLKNGQPVTRLITPPEVGR